MANVDDRGNEWDYVIAGGGTAGCVLANRLSADPKVRVLLLEAGGWDRHPLLHIPAGRARFSDRFDWGYEGAPDPTRHDKIDAWGAGRVLGGGSTINMMFWVRGERSDYDGWRDQGCPGWGYDDVLPCFKKAETFAGGPTRYRGGNGPIGVTRVSTPLEVTDDFLAAAQEAGHPLNSDYNGERQQGVAVTQTNQKRGLRSSTARAYLAPVRRRQNLSIKTGALVQRVRIENGRATGVEYELEGQQAFAAAAKEVIMSAGALASPKLLMLSGIGPAEHLGEHGIEVKLDAPGVGSNLQDHGYGMMMYTTKADTLAEELKPWRALKHGINYVFRRKGALTMSGCAAIVFLQLTGEQPTEAEILLIPMGMSFRDKAGEESSEHNINKIKPLPHGMMVYPCMVHPSSRGTLRLASSNPSAPPILSHELMNDHDMTALIAACRKTREIFATSAMKAKAVVEELPGASVQSDEEWSDYLRNATFRVNHPIGTCRMGTDDGAVVDPELRVRGIQGLRVVDASIFPTITSGPTNAPTIMIAERAAELILDSGTPD